MDVDTATNVAAKFFNDLPLNVSFARAARIESEAEMAQRLEGAENFTNAAILRGQPGRYDDDDLEDDRSSSKIFIRSALDQIKREQERQREEHMRSMATFAGVAMTGAQWQGMSEALSQDSPLRRWLIDRMKRDGKTEREAEELARQMGRAAAIMAKPEGERTSDERAFLDRVEQNPDMHRYLDAADRFGRDPAAAVSADTNTAMNGTNIDSVSAQADAFEGFATAPDASTHYRAALAATVPLDAPRVPAAPTIERPISPPTVDSGFAV